jgi:hypothetical protein
MLMQTPLETTLAIVSEHRASYDSMLAAGTLTGDQYRLSLAVLDGLAQRFRDRLGGQVRTINGIPQYGEPWTVQDALDREG